MIPRIHNIKVNRPKYSSCLGVGGSVCVVPALGRQRKKDQELKVRHLGYLKSCLNDVSKMYHGLAEQTVCVSVSVCMYVCVSP